jgi:D-alanine transaminase
VYEVIPCYGGRLFRLDEHLRRLDNSLRAIRMDNPLPDSRWSEILKKLIAQRPERNLSVYVQVTRGYAEKRDHCFPDHVRPTVFCMANPIPPTQPEVAEKGISAITLTDIRWRHCNIKAITLLPNILLRQQAADQDAMEAILIRDGLATEGAASNLFLVKDGILHTPPEGPHLLPGITRTLVLELAEQHGIHFVEQQIPETWLANAEEIWLTSSTREIMPVTRLNHQPVASGTPGPLWRRMTGLYRDYKARL